MRKKKILFIAKNIPIPNRTTGNKIVYTIANKLTNYYDIDFFFPKSIVPWGLHFFKKHKPLFNLPDWTFDTHQIYAVPFAQLPGLKYTYWLFNKLPKRAKLLFQNKSYDLIHAHYGMPDGYMAYLLSQQYDIPYVLTVRSHDFNHIKKLSCTNPDYKKYLIVLSNASKILVLNKPMERFIKELGFKSQILPHGIDSPSFEYKKVKKEAIHVTCVSQYLKRKNIEWVIDSYLAYAGKKKLKLTLVGDMVNLPPNYKTKCKSNNIELIGKLPHNEVLHTLNKSDIFVLPSVKETFGLVYIEAASMNNAIIGHVNEGVCGVFEEDNEMLFAKDFNDFSCKLHYLIDNDDSRKFLAKQARIKSKSLSWDKITERYQDIYESCS